MQHDTEWLAREERGTSWLIRFMVVLCQKKFNWLVNILLYPIAGYFYLTSGPGHKASRHFFINATGSFRRIDHYLQILCFSRTIVDRVRILLGESHHFQVNSHGREQLMQCKQQGRGMILLGAHLGNFEACKMLVKERAGIDVHIVAYVAGAQKLRRQLAALNPEIANNIIDPTASDAVFKMHDVIKNGGILAILGDRTGIGERKLIVDFLGQPAVLPAGPYLLASILNCPIYCFFGLWIKDGVYDSYTFKLADLVRIRRKHREQDAQTYAQAYADLMAEKARQYPYNWFNFFEFWLTKPDSAR